MRDRKMECTVDQSSQGQETPDSSTTFTPDKYKIVLLGDGGTGKSSYVSMLRNASFRKEYIATLGVEKQEISLTTSHGPCIVSLWDTAGQEKLGPLRDGYYTGAHAAFIFFDVTSRITYKNVPNWHRDVLRVCPDIPVVLCANKTDVKERKVKSKGITYHTKEKMGFYEMSVKERICLKEPLQYLLQQVTKEPELTIKDSVDAELFSGVGELSLLQPT